MSNQYDNTNRGVLFRNKDKKTDKHPDYTGQLNVDGKEFFLDAWLNESKNGTKYLAVKVKAKMAREQGGSRNPPAQSAQDAPPDDDFNDSLPF